MAFYVNFLAAKNSNKEVKAYVTSHVVHLAMAS